MPFTPSWRDYWIAANIILVLPIIAVQENLRRYGFMSRDTPSVIPPGGGSTKLSFERMNVSVV